MYFHYSCGMRWLTILLSIALLCDNFAPSQTPIGTSCGGSTSIDLLDVCGTAADRISEDHEMPSVAERSGTARPAASFGCIAPTIPVLVPFLPTAPDEHPPRTA